MTGDLDFGDVGTRTPDISVLSHDDLVTEVRRLRLRLSGLRRQRDDLLVEIRAVGGESSDGDEQEQEMDWRSRALAAEEELSALMATKSMRALHVFRAGYHQLRMSYAHARGGGRTGE